MTNEKVTESERIFEELTKGFAQYIGSYGGVGEAVCLDGWFTKNQLAIILYALDKADSIEAQQKEKRQ